MGKTPYILTSEQEEQLKKIYSKLSGSHSEKNSKIEKIWQSQYSDCLLKGSSLTRKARELIQSSSALLRNTSSISQESLTELAEFNASLPNQSKENRERVLKMHHKEHHSESALSGSTLRRYLKKPPKNPMKNVNRFWSFGHNLSCTPLFHGCCFVCSRLITHQSRRYPKRRSNIEQFPIAEHYENINDIPYEADDGSYFICSSCSQGKSNPLEEYPLVAGGDFIHIPDEIKCLKKPEVSQVALVALFSRTPQQKSLSYQKGQYEHKIGQVNALHKDDKRYLAMYTMYIAEEDKIKLTNSDQRIKTALHCLRRINRLYDGFYSNYDTLFRFYSRAYPGFSGFLPIYGPKFIPENFFKRKRDFLNKEKEGMFVLSDFGSDAVISDTAVQHVIEKHSLNIIDMTYLNIHSKFLEEKIWPNLFPFGTGGWHKSSSFTRREYAKFRLAMYDDRFRMWSTFSFFMLDVIIKDTLISANYARTVKKGNMESLSL